MNSYHIAIDGKPCRLDRRFSALPIAFPVSDLAAVDSIGTGDAARKRAHRIIHRTVKVARTLRESVLADSPVIAPIVNARDYKVVRTKLA